METLQRQRLRSHPLLLREFKNKLGTNILKLERLR